MKYKYSINLSFLFLLLLVISFSQKAQAQDELINGVKNAIKTSNYKELGKYFNEMVDLGFDGEKGSYSKTQAEYVMKDFFQKNPNGQFQYVHKGASKEGLTYTIGSYQSKGVTYQVLIYIKEVKQIYKIDYLDFSKE